MKGCFSLLIAQHASWLQGQFFFRRLSAVKIFACISSQSKKLCFPSACALQMALDLNGETDPLDCARYTDFADVFHHLSIFIELCRLD